MGKKELRNPHASSQPEPYLTIVKTFYVLQSTFYVLQSGSPKDQSKSSGFNGSEPDFGPEPDPDTRPMFDDILTAPLLVQLSSWDEEDSLNVHTYKRVEYKYIAAMLQ